MLQIAFDKVVLPRPTNLTLGEHRSILEWSLNLGPQDPFLISVEDTQVTMRVKWDPDAPAEVKGSPMGVLYYTSASSFLNVVPTVCSFVHAALGMNVSTFQIWTLYTREGLVSLLPRGNFRVQDLIQTIGVAHCPLHGEEKPFQFGSGGSLAPGQTFPPIEKFQ